MIRNIIFDLDGTLLNTLGDLTDSVNASLQHFSLPAVSQEDVRRGIGNGALRLLQSVTRGLSDAEMDALLSYYVPYYQSHCEIRTAPYPGIIPLLDALRSSGIQMAIVSNKGDGAVKALAEKYFPGMMLAAVGETAGIRRKPAPDSVLRAMQLCGGTPEDTLYVGDSEVDYETACNASLPCVLVSWGFRSRELLEALPADHLIDQPMELLNLLGRQHID